MLFVQCAAPSGAVQAAPLTSMPLGLREGHGTATAFWLEDDSYRVRVEGVDATSWYRIDADLRDDEPADQAARLALSNFLANVTSIGRGHVAFPVGSSGRRVYRVWRGNRDLARTRILAVRVAQSRRRPA